MDLPDISRRLVATINDKVSLSSLAWLLTKVIFIIGASCLAAIAQFADVDRFSDLSQWQIIGICAAVAAGLGGLIVTIRERDSAKELSLAQEALDAARSVRAELAVSLNEFDEQAGHLRRVVSLYLAIRSMRSVLESTAANNQTDVELIRTLLIYSSRSLKIALNFRLDEHWTIAVYRSEKNESEDRRYLRCIAQERSFECNINDARLWPEGSVPAGVSLALKAEIAVPDTAASNFSSMMDLGKLAKEDDAVRYRSMFAAPVLVDGHDRAWGVVMATSSRPYHFDCGGPDGVRTAEAVRTLADMIALGLAVHKPSSHAGTL